MKNKAIEKLCTTFLGKNKGGRFYNLISAGGDLFLYKNSYLNTTGWVESFQEQKPISSNAVAIPWVTYSFIAFIEQRLHKELTIFEYGSGNSTIYYANACKQVTAVENDKNWFSMIESQMPANVTLLFESLTEKDRYVKQAIAEQQQAFDIIIVDGRKRVACVKTAIEHLSERGVVVLDDSERTQYQEAFSFMKAQGFKQLDFWGLAPGMVYNKCTSVFYREENCLGI
ncbi:class I SAM-dependent methyltransferase [Algivirga pacifica]|uniref:FkbM family methyltransferase n=1 Tax=Algivirga pacifica TaxID=1162670 RepID=A0ABP9DJQ8_9BACT